MGTKRASTASPSPSSNGTTRSAPVSAARSADARPALGASFIALQLSTGRVLKATESAAEIGEFSAELTDAERGDVLIFHASRFSR